MSSSLILISQDQADVRFATAVAATAGLVLRVVPAASQAVAMVDSEGPCVLLVDASNEARYLEFEQAVQKQLGLFSSKLDANQIYYLSSQDIYEVPYLIQSPLMGSYIHRNFEQDPKVGEYFGRVLAAGAHGKAFGTDRVVRPGTKVQVIRLERSGQKQEAVEAVRAYLIALKFQSRMATVISNAVDEILMNAIFDAPVDEAGRRFFDQTSRATGLTLDGQSTVELHVAYDGDYVVLTAIDLFGSLDKGKLLSSLSKIYTQSEYRVRSSVAGAGIGLASVFHSGGSFLFASEKGTRTEVTVFFRRCDSFREFKEQFRFISTQFYF